MPILAVTPPMTAMGTRSQIAAVIVVGGGGGGGAKRPR